MNIYEFQINTWSKNLDLEKRTLEVEEKPKTYTVTSGAYYSRINKSDIGIISGYSKDTVLLLEDDIEKAKELFLKELERRISVEETRIKSANKSIEQLKKQIGELSLYEIKESEK